MELKNIHGSYQKELERRKKAKEDDGACRTFETGATRDTAEGKLDMEGFTHPMVMEQYAKYMNMNRLQSDGKLRASDNWQKGIPKDAYIKSLRRHHDQVWKDHRGFTSEAGIIADLCGLMFNAMGYLHEELKERNWVLQDFDGAEPTPEMKERLEKIKNEKHIGSTLQGTVGRSEYEASLKEALHNRAEISMGQPEKHYDASGIALLGSAYAHKELGVYREVGDA